VSLAPLLRIVEASWHTADNIARTTLGVAMRWPRKRRRRRVGGIARRAAMLPISTGGRARWAHSKTRGWIVDLTDARPRGRAPPEHCHARQRSQLAERADKACPSAGSTSNLLLRLTHHHYSDRGPGVRRRLKSPFIGMARNATSTVDRFGLPSERTVRMRSQVALRLTLSKRGRMSPPRPDGAIE
jgi:hypothetical protein